MFPPSVPSALSLRPLRSTHDRPAPPILEPLEPRLLLSAAPAVSAVWETTDGGNGHRYEVIVVEGGVSWDEANDQATASGGYLATITSQNENDFIADLINDPAYWHRLPVLGTQTNGPWIGGVRPVGSPGAATDGWQWVTGEAWSFTHWANLEPNNVATERFVHFAARGTLTSDRWASFENDSTRFYIQAYIVEYDAPAQLPNNPPTFESAPVTAALETREYVYDITAADPDGDALAIAAQNLPAWLTLVDHGDGTATLSGAPGADELGEHLVRISVSDGDAIVEQPFTLDVASIGRIEGRLFHDADRDGVFDDGETPFAGWTVFVDANANGVLDDGEVSTRSAADGTYAFQSVQPGEHLVRAIAPFDPAMLDRYVIQVTEKGRTTSLPVAAGDRVRITPVDGSSLLIRVETGKDGRFDDLVLKVTHDLAGRVTLTIVSRQGPGQFDFLDTASGKTLLCDIGRKHNPVGKSIVLNYGWKMTTGHELARSVITLEGDILGNEDFALTRSTGQPLVKVKPGKQLARCLVKHLLTERPKQVAKLQVLPVADLLLGAIKAGKGRPC